MKFEQKNEITTDNNTEINKTPELIDKNQEVEIELEKENDKLEKNLEEFANVIDELGGEKGVNDAIEKLGEKRIANILNMLKTSANKIIAAVEKIPVSVGMGGLAAGASALIMYVGSINSVETATVATVSAVAGVLTGAITQMINSSTEERDYYAERYGKKKSN